MECGTHYTCPVSWGLPEPKSDNRYDKVVFKCMALFAIGYYYCWVHSKTHLLSPEAGSHITHKLYKVGFKK